MEIMAYIIRIHAPMRISVLLTYIPCYSTRAIQWQVQSRRNGRDNEVELSTPVGHSTGEVAAWNIMQDEVY